MTPDRNDKDLDARLDLEVRAHFAQTRESIEVPSFEAVMARAEAADAVAEPKLRFEWLRNLLEGWSVQTRWVGAAAAAAAVTLALLITVQTNEQRVAEEGRPIAQHKQMRTAAEQQLLASLESTTRWQAPSDRWLAVKTDIDIFGLPDIGGAEVLKEESTWL